MSNSWSKVWEKGMLGNVKTQILDFKRGTIVTGDSNGIIREINESSIAKSGPCVTYIVQLAEDQSVQLNRLDYVAVKRNPGKSRNLGFEIMERSRRLKEKIEKGREDIRRGDAWGIMDPSPAEGGGGKVGKLVGVSVGDREEKVREEDDRCYRFLMHLPHGTKEAPVVRPDKFCCNICNSKELVERGTQGRKTKKAADHQAKKRRVFSLHKRELMDCIRLDRKNFIQQFGQAPKGMGVMMIVCMVVNVAHDFLDLIWPAHQVRTVEAVLVKHCREHPGKIQHHFAVKRMKTAVWAWEMTVGFVAQVMLQESLFRVGLVKSVFEGLVKEYDVGAVKGALGAVIGGSLMVDPDIFYQKLIGTSYNGLYLPADAKVIQENGSTVRRLRTERKEAVDRVVTKAKQGVNTRKLATGDGIV